LIIVDWQRYLWGYVHHFQPPPIPPKAKAVGFLEERIVNEEMEVGSMFRKKRSSLIGI
jgi:hypothetical protein